MVLKPGAISESPWKLWDLHVSNDLSFWGDTQTSILKRIHTSSERLKQEDHVFRTNLRYIIEYLPVLETQ